MIFEQTTDSFYVHRCLTDPAVWRMSSDDGMLGVKPELFFVHQNVSFWLKASDYGVLIFEPKNFAMVEMHLALLPSARGKAMEICRGAIEWMFVHSDYHRIFASIPEFNNLAIKLASKVGMKFIGINKKSFMKNSVLYDQHLFGISKEDICHF